MTTTATTETTTTIASASATASGGSLGPSPGIWCDGGDDVDNGSTDDDDGWRGVVDTRGDYWCWCW